MLKNGQRLSVYLHAWERTKMDLKRLATRFGVVLGALALLAVVGKADTVYTYTGNPFNQFFGATCPPECNISGSFTVSTPLAPNLTSLFIFTPNSFSFTDGIVTITQANATASAFEVITDSLGNITGWNNEYFSGNFLMFSSTNPPGCVGCSITDQSGVQPNVRFAAINNSAGTWSFVTTPVPEPSSVLLLGTGLLALLCLGARKF
jgi:hypothetical protein